MFYLFYAHYLIFSQANFVETAPLALILLGTIEYNDYVPEWALIALSSALVVGRVMHGYAFSFLHPLNVHLRFRVSSFAMTLTTIGISGTVLFVNGIKNYFKL